MTAPVPDIEALILGAVLDADGAVLASNAGALLDLAGLKHTDFSNAHVRNAWRIVETLIDRRRPVGADTVATAGATARVLPEGSGEWLRRLQGANTLDRSAFAEVVEQLRRRRRGEELRKVLAEGLAKLEAGDVEPSKVAAELEGQCHDVSVAGVGSDEVCNDVLELGIEWEKRDVEGRPLLVPTGIRAIDEQIGGLPPNLSVFAGLPSVGKSALLATCIEQQLLAGFKVGLFGLEDGTRWLSKRIVARRLGIPVRDVGVKPLSSLTAEQQGRYPVVMQEAHALVSAGLVPFRRDTVSSAELVRRAAHWVQNLGVQCIYVDHGGEVEHDTARFEDFRLAVADTYRHVRNFAVRYQVPVVVLAHTNRASERPDGEEVPPRASDLAESAYIERRARLILGLWRRQGEADAMRVTVLKQTEGRAGQTLLLNRHTSAAMIDAESGHEVNLGAERAAEARKKREAREAEKLAKAEVLAKAREATKKPARQQLGFGESP